MVQIAEVCNHAQLKKFVEFPNRLYRDVPQFVPATYGDDMEDWDRNKNRAFAFCEARCWLAMRDGEIVGRIGAILNHRANEKWNTSRMRFTQVDFIDDAEVSKALFATVEQWAREKGCDEVHGPLGFTDMDREGMLVEGFDHRSMFFTYYNHPYYLTHMAALGYEKDVDWIENLITVPTDEATCARLQRIADVSMKRFHLHLADARHQRDFKPLIPAFFRLVNTCYSPLYAMVELTEEQIGKYAGKFAPLINPKLSAFVMNEAGEMVGLGVGAPSIDAALQKSQGKLFPFGWTRLLWALHHNDTIDLLLIGVRPDYQGRGVNAIIMNKMLQGCHEMGITMAETGPTLELNEKVLAQWKGLDKVQHKRRRCFIKQLH